MESIDIKVVSDIVCPWCYIGKARLEKAIAKLPHINFNIEWIPFQLNPDVPENGILLYDYLQDKFGSKERVEEMFDQLEAVAADEGIQMTFSKEQFLPNTLKSHYLIQRAKDIQTQGKIKNDLFKAFFTDNKTINDEFLNQVAEQYSIDIDWNIFPEEKEKLIQKENIFKAQGINAVPSFIINNQYLVQGAQKTDVFADAFQKLLKENDVKQEDRDACNVDGERC